jgi:hypothetical protein
VVIKLNKKAIGLVTLSAISLMVLVGCRKTYLEESQKEMTRSKYNFQYEVETRQNKDTIIDLSNIGMDEYEDRLIFSRGSTIIQNDIKYIDVTKFIVLASEKEKDDARIMNAARIKKNKITGKHNPIPMFTMTLNDSAYFLEFDDKNNNLLYVKDTPRENVLVDIPIQIIYKERIIINGNKVYVPLSTLQKIINIKTATNPKRYRIETEG